ncbi:RNase adapter RapZ [Undibacterium oligocarboniphilum]|uniref:RNase adapter RapZ n=1 Tax=Undibacterium oligocarboniphilum TaxID=666702 RepID=A0A850QHQ7_9BURK|nr:RNase adapter RapZ [Undibacterium oligocarboniphilum]MBC3870530.1 RNase adapter RapZ [Undibacterium oligocarboniphilum]NVO78669.1 RNase adapter RapZ [Undibacterium oligocarboniphilum]
MQILVISGISGSGKSVVLNVVEDAGYYCVDNLPPSLLPELITTLSAQHYPQVAVAIDSRSAHLLTGMPETVQALRQAGHAVKVLFLTASTESLVARFSETRRSHPLSHWLTLKQTVDTHMTLTECIEEEREILAEIQALAHIIDTTDLRANQLRNWVKEVIEIQHAPLTLMFESFAFKRGVPLDADFVFDVRMLPNPHYDLDLRPLTGRDEPVIRYLEAQPVVQEMYADILQFLSKWIPSFKEDNRSYLTIAIGCTGGQHRSVYMVEKLTQHFRSAEQVLVRHRRLG